jgi:tetratricopeptide (TPR) repeat protein
MTDCRKLLAFAALIAVMLGAGCGGGDPGPVAAEMDEPAFRQGQQRLREGRAPEALTWFLKVIDRRGVQNSPESHLQAGVIYLQYIKDPVEAYHHFRKYLELQPNSRESVLVRQQLDAAKREFAAALPARPDENQAVRFESAEELDRLRRENAELRAENATLRGSAGRSPRSLVTVPALTPPAPTPVPALPVEDSPITAVPTVPAPRTQATQTAPATPNLITPAPTRAAPAPARSVAAPTRTAPAAALPIRPAASGRTHTVQQSEGLFAIARRYDAANASRKLREIIDANPDVLTAGANTPLKPGMVLRIP